MKAENQRKGGLGKKLEEEKEEEEEATHPLNPSRLSNGFRPSELQDGSFLGREAADLGIVEIKG